jgi:type II secretory pathway pseudopilin PulG
MDKEVVAAIITAVGTVLAAIAAGLIPWLLRQIQRAKAAQAAARQAQEAARQAEEAANVAKAAAVSAAVSVVESVPHVVDRVITTVVIADAAGNGSLQRQLIGVHARKGERLPRFRTRLTTSGAFDQSSPIEIEHSSIGKGIKTEYAFPNSRTCDIELEFIGGLSDADPLLDISVKARMTAAFILKEDAIAAAYGRDGFRFEYIAEAIDTDVKELQIAVEFPPALAPATFPVVFYHGSEDLAQDQLDLLPKIDESLPNHARLAIQRPSPSFRYGLYWIGLK